jgi:hypothetical protein
MRDSIRTLPLLLLPSLLLGVGLTSSTAEAAETRRFALSIGANDGGDGRVMLRYASSDAEAVNVLLDELGGVQPADNVLLEQPTTAGLSRAIDELSDRVRAAEGEGEGVRTEAIVYYSGHSDSAGLLLGGERLRYDVLRSALEEVPADVQIVILDSCSSGALIRGKGGAHLPAFLVDEAVAVSGHAYLMSSSFDETAQEADAIEGSYFTQALLTGLRGGADTTGDGRVTLSEVYQYAYATTLSQTESSQLGPQHAARDIQLVGTGDLVITDVAATGSALLIEEDMAGRLSVRDDKGNLVAELQKDTGRPLTLGLGPGHYRVLWVGDALTGEAQIDLAAGETVSVESLALTPVPQVLAVARGGDSAAPEPRHVPFHAGFLTLGRMSPEDPATIEHFSFDFVGGRSYAVEGFDLSIGANIVEQDVRGLQLTAGVNVVGGDAGGVQIAAGANIVRGAARGVQIAAGPNIADEMSGLQLSVINIGGTVNGAQIGVVNIGGTVKGAQIGVVNVAKDLQGVGVGVINYSHTGIRAIELYTTESVPLNLGFKLGSRHIYTAWSAGIEPGQVDYIATSGAIGGRIGTDGPHVDVDLGVTNHMFLPGGKSQTLITHLRANAGLPIKGRLTIYGGPSVNLLVQQQGRGESVGPYFYDTFQGDGTAALPWWIGFNAGVRY